MSKYLLLRDNKQTGPHSFDEMLELGFRKYDLVWVEGKSAAWRYPGEISEFREYAPLVEEQPYDRFFKRNIAPAAAEKQPAATIAAPVETKQKPATASELLKARRVAITMPAKRNSEQPVAAPRRKETVPIPPEKKEQDLPTLAEPEPVVVKADVLPPVEHLQKTKGSATVEAGISTQHSQYLPGAAPVASLTDAMVEEDERVPLPQIPSRPESLDHTGLLQYVGVAAALVSLLVVGILIGKSMGTTTTPPPTLLSDQPSRIAELKKKLMEAPLPEGPGTGSEIVSPEQNSARPAVNVPVKTTAVQTNKNISVPASYHSTAESPLTDADGKRESVKRTSVPATAPTTEKADLASQLHISLNEYKVNLFGGIDGIEVTLKNEANVTVNEAVVELRYVLSNRNKKHLTETLVFTNLSPGESRTLPGPKSAKGIKLEYELISAR